MKISEMEPGTECFTNSKADDIIVTIQRLVNTARITLILAETNFLFQPVYNMNDIDNIDIAEYTECKLLFPRLVFRKP